MNALTSSGILPHFGVGIDPTEEQFKRLQLTQLFRFPFFFQGRINHNALLCVQGPKLYLNGSHGYLTAQWLESKLGIDAEVLEEGVSVFTFAVAIAVALGCNPLIFVGLDLAYTEDQLYAPGVVSNTDLVFEEEKRFDQTPFVTRDIYGKEVKTHWNWVRESEWLAEFHEKNPSVTMLNATEGGLGVKGIEDLSLEEVERRFLKDKRAFKIETILTRMPVQQGQVNECLSQLQTSLERCIVVLEKMLVTEETALLEFELTSEVGYQAVLAIFDEVFRHIQRAQDRNAFIQRCRYLKECAEINIEQIKN